MNLLLLTLTLGLVVLVHETTGLAIYRRNPVLEKRDQVLHKQIASDQIRDKRIRTMTQRPAKRYLYDKRIFAAIEKRLPKDKRIFAAIEKRLPKEKRIFAAVEKRQFQPGVTYYTYEASPGQTVYYYQLSDGTIRYVQPGQTYPVQQPVQQPTQSSGGFLNFLSKPLTAAGNIVKAVGDTASNIVSLPFNVADQVIEGVGLGDTGIGRLATGVLDVGEAVLQTPVGVVSAVGQAPFRLASDVAQAIKE